MVVAYWQKRGSSMKTTAEARFALFFILTVTEMQVSVFSATRENFRTIAKNLNSYTSNTVSFVTTDSTLHFTTFKFAKVNLFRFKARRIGVKEVQCYEFRFSRMRERRKAVV